MKLLVYSVFDQAVKAFLPPFFARSTGEATRSFIEACNDEKHQFHRHFIDYTLFCVGAFDDSSGVLEPLVAPSRVIGAAEAIVPDEKLFPPEKRLPM